MAVLAFGLLGAGIGTAIGGTLLGMSAASIGWSIGSTLGSLLFAPDGPDTQGPRLNDLRVQSSARGADIPTVYGTSRIAGNIIWSAGIKETANTQSSGGKGGGGGSHTSYTYSCSFAIGLCEGEITGIRRIWADSVLIYDKGDTATADELAVSNQLGITVYTGSEEQEADPTIEATAGAGNTPAYRGLAYIVFTDLQLENYGNRIPNITCEVVKDGAPSFSQTFNVDLHAGIGQSRQQGYYYDGTLIYAVSCAPLSTYEQTVTEYTVSPDGTVTQTNQFDFYDGHDDNLYASNDWPVGMSDEDGYCIMAYQHPNHRLYYYFPDRTIAKLGNFERYSDTHWCKHGEYIYVRHGRYSDYLSRFNVTGPGDYSGSGTSLTIPYLTGYGSVSGLYTIRANDSYVFAAANVLGYAEPFIIRWPFGSSTSDAFIKLQGYASAGSFEVEGVSDILVIPANSKTIYSYKNFSTTPSALYATDTDMEYVASLGLSYTAWVSTSSLAIFNEGTAESFQATLSLNTVSLSSIIADLCSTVYASSNDTTAVTDLVKGYVRTSRMTAAAAIAPLLNTYNISASESDFTLKFFPRSGVPSDSITKDDLSARESSSETDPLKITRNQNLELPRKITVKYTAFEGDYQVGVQQAQRIRKDG
jgi:hypothetical protein